MSRTTATGIPRPNGQQPAGFVPVVGSLHGRSSRASAMRRRIVEMSNLPVCEMCRPAPALYRSTSMAVGHGSHWGDRLGWIGRAYRASSKNAATVRENAATVRENAVTIRKNTATAQQRHGNSAVFGRNRLPKHSNAVSTVHLLCSSGLSGSAPEMAAMGTERKEGGRDACRIDHLRPIGRDRT